MPEWPELVSLSGMHFGLKPYADRKNGPSVDEQAANGPVLSYSK